MIIHQHILEENLPLGGYVDEYVKQTTGPVMEFLAEMVKGRKPFIMNATRDVFIRFFLRKEFL
jgi:hypothetical protein